MNTQATSESSNLSTPLFNEDKEPSSEKTSIGKNFLGSTLKSVVNSPNAQNLAQKVVERVKETTLGKAFSQKAERADSPTESLSVSDHSSHSSVETINDLIPTNLADYQLQPKNQKEPLIDWRRYTDHSSKETVVTSTQQEYSSKNLGASLLQGVDEITKKPYARKQKSYEDYRHLSD